MRKRTSILNALAAAAALVTTPALVTAQNETPAPPAGAAPAPGGAGAQSNPVVVTVDGTPIKAADVQEMIMARYGRQLQQMPAEQRSVVQPQIQQMVMRDLISKILLLNAADEAGYEASEEEVQEGLDGIAERLPEDASLEQFAAASARSPTKLPPTSRSRPEKK